MAPLSPAVADADTLARQARKLLQDRQTGEALEFFLRALEKSPKHTGILSETASLLMGEGRSAEAIPYLEKLVRLDSSPSTHDMLGNALQAAGRPADAIPRHREAIRLYKGYADAHNNLGNALAALGRHREAVEAFRQALALAPQSPQIHNNLGNSLQELGLPDEALAHYLKSVATGNSPIAHGNLGNALLGFGRYEEAVRHFRTALSFQPDLDRVRSNLLFGLNFVPGVSPAQYLAEARKFGEIVHARARATPLSLLPPRVSSGRPIRIAFMSGDFKAHPVAYFLESMLHQADRERFTWIGCTTRAYRDDTTDRLEAAYQEWFSVAGKGDREAAEFIRANRIDILIDLSGHTAFNRLAILAWRPAPLQISWLGYFASTGLDEIDFMLTDAVSSPAGDEADFTERLWRLPDTRLCFTPPSTGDDLPVSEPPYQKNGHVTYGCFQRTGKINDDVVAVWSEILMAAPDAKLMMKAKHLSNPETRESWIRRFAMHGVPADRLQFEEESPRTEYLQDYRQVDIMLDTFPFPGGTTTCEALWMGVPTVTLTGDRLLARQGESLLSAAGLGDWVARSREEYVRKAVSFAADPHALATLRARLRQDVSGSPLMDARRFARNLEQALIGMREQSGR